MRRNQLRGAFLWDFLALSPCFRKAYGNCLLAAFYPATLPPRASFRGAALVALHFPFDVFRGTFRIFASFFAFTFFAFLAITFLHPQASQRPGARDAEPCKSCLLTASGFAPSSNDPESSEAFSRRNSSAWHCRRLWNNARTARQHPCEHQPGRYRSFY